jgi:hypothetical protein
MMRKTANMPQRGGAVGSLMGGVRPGAMGPGGGGAPRMPQEQVRQLPTPPRGGAPTPMPIKQVPMMKKGGAVKGYAKGGKATRGDGCCMKGKTKGMMK